jgi:hypothetical protein
MTTPRDADRILRAWLDLMPDEAPDRTVAAVLQAVETTPQTRRPLAFGPRRSISMTRFALIAAATALGVALLGGALLVGGGRPDAPAITPAPVMPASPSASAASDPAPAALRANWLAEIPATGTYGAIEGLVRLVVTSRGNAASVQPASGRMALQSAVSATGADELTIARVAQAGVDCPEGSAGRYRWSVADDRATMTLTLIEDACAVRADVLARTWTRTHTGISDGGTAVVPGVGPLFEVTLPAGSYSTQTGTDSQEIYQDSPEYTLFAWKNPQAYADPCTLDERRPWKPGATAFVDALKQNPALENFTTEETTIGGYPALHVEFNARPDYPKCSPDHAFYEWAPKDDPGGVWWLSAGDKDGLFLVDHPDATLMYQVLPVGDASEAAVMQSIRFLDRLPTGP